jgi:hypothetical protein
MCSGLSVDTPNTEGKTMREKRQAAFSDFIVKIEYDSFDSNTR